MRNFTESSKTIEAKKAMVAAIEAADNALKHGQPYAEKGGLLDKAKDAVTEVNASIINDVVNDFVAIAKGDKSKFWKEYMEDWSVQGYAVQTVMEKRVPTAIRAKSDDKTVLRVPFSAIDSAMSPDSAARIAVNPRWGNMLQLWARNACANVAKESFSTVLETPEDLVTLELTLGKPWIDDKKAPRFSNTALAEQFNLIISAVFGDNIKAKMDKKDVVRFTQSLFSYVKTATNKAIAYKAATKISDLEVRFFDVVYTNINNLSATISDDFKRTDNSKKDDTTRGLDETIVKAATEIKALNVDMETLAKALEAVKSGAVA